MLWQRNVRNFAKTRAGLGLLAVDMWNFIVQMMGVDCYSS